MKVLAALVHKEGVQGGGGQGLARPLGLVGDSLHNPNQLILKGRAMEGFDEGASEELEGLIKVRL